MPRFQEAEGVVEGDRVRRGLLDDDLAAGFQQAQDGGLPGAGGAGQDVSGHGGFLRGRAGVVARPPRAVGSIGVVPRPG
ncbi:MAG TPA: hypothetical protein VNO31_13405 [Umezawaea sp.]|nr:hypothetical protein [Umezawaea sp.]